MTKRNPYRITAGDPITWHNPKSPEPDRVMEVTKVGTTYGFAAAPEHKDKQALWTKFTLATGRVEPCAENNWSPNIVIITDEMRRDRETRAAAMATLKAAGFEVAIGGTARVEAIPTTVLHQAAAMVRPYTL